MNVHTMNMEEILILTKNKRSKKLGRLFYENNNWQKRCNSYNKLHKYVNN